jgi:hypothetical protein
MGLFTKKVILNFFLYFFIFFIFCFQKIKSENLDFAKKEFLLGNYESAIDISSKLNDLDSKIFQARSMSVYAHFFLKDEVAKNKFLEAYEIVKNASLEETQNADVYLEAAHALGRYGQKIGIMSAITEGIADRVKRYLNKALKIDDSHTLANLSKGLWHAEIINQAGKTLAKALYGANLKKARNHFSKVYNSGKKEISILYELSYGYYLLGEDEDLILAKKYLKELSLIESKAHIEKAYKNKAIKLQNKIIL